MWALHLEYGPIPLSRSVTLATSQTTATGGAGTWADRVRRGTGDPQILTTVQDSSPAALAVAAPQPVESTVLVWALEAVQATLQQVVVELAGVCKEFETE